MRRVRANNASVGSSARAFDNRYNPRQIAVESPSVCVNEYYTPILRSMCKSAFKRNWQRCTIDGYASIAVPTSRNSQRLTIAGHPIINRVLTTGMKPDTKRRSVA